MDRNIYLQRLSKPDAAYCPYLLGSAAFLARKVIFRLLVSLLTLYVKMSSRVLCACLCVSYLDLCSCCWSAVWPVLYRFTEPKELGPEAGDLGCEVQLSLPHVSHPSQQPAPS